VHNRATSLGEDDANNAHEEHRLQAAEKADTEGQEKEQHQRQARTHGQPGRC